MADFWQWEIFVGMQVWVTENQGGENWAIGQRKNK